MLQDAPQHSGNKFGSEGGEAAENSLSDSLPLSSSNRRPETVSICVDSLELRGKFESDLLICNLHATLDADGGSVAMPI
nr:hypothetical protein [Sinorhizobium meliloti]